MESNLCSCSKRRIPAATLAVPFAPGLRRSLLFSAVSYSRAQQGRRCSQPIAAQSILERRRRNLTIMVRTLRDACSSSKDNNKPSAVVVSRVSKNLQASSSVPSAEVATASLQQILRPPVLAVVAGFALLVLAIKKLLDTPSRKYDPDNPNVGESYDTWEQ